MNILSDMLTRRILLLPPSCSYNTGTILALKSHVAIRPYEAYQHLKPVPNAPNETLDNDHPWNREEGGEGRDAQTNTAFGSAFLSQHRLHNQHHPRAAARLIKQLPVLACALSKAPLGVIPTCKGSKPKP